MINQALIQRHNESNDERRPLFPPHNPKNIGYVSLLKNIFSIALPVSMYNLVSTVSDILRILMITSLSEDKNKLAAYSVVNGAVPFLLCGQNIFDVMEGMISKECPDKNNFEGGGNVGSILQSAWILAVIFSVPAIIVTLNLSSILRLMGQDKEICDNVRNVVALLSVVVPMQIILAVNTTFLTCTSKRNLVLFSLNAAGVGLIVSFCLAVTLLKHSVINAIYLGLIAEALVALITSTGYILFCKKYKPLFIKKIQFRRLKKQFKTLFFSGIPIVLYAAVESAIDIAIVLMYGWSGSNSILLSSVAVQIIYLASPFFSAIDRAGCILVGRSFGAKNFSNVRRYGYFTLALNVLLTVVLLVVYLAIPMQITSLFINPGLFSEFTIRSMFFLVAVKKILETIVGNSVANLEGVIIVSGPAITNIVLSLFTIIPLSALFAFVVKLDIVGITLGCTIAVSAISCNSFLWWIMSSRDSSLEKNYSKDAKSGLQLKNENNFQKVSTNSIEMKKISSPLSIFSYNKVDSSGENQSIDTSVAIYT